MNAKILLTATGLATAGLCLAGCRTQPSPPPTSAPVGRAASCPPPPKPTPPPKPMPRTRTTEQIQILQDFAIKESPKTWQTIQSMRGEIADSGRRIRTLRSELQDFGRNPDADEDYKALVAGLDELKRAHDAIFDKLESAYIAAKKYEASPSRKDYQDVMKRALEDGIQDAAMATERYKAMTRQK